MPFFACRSESHFLVQDCKKRALHRGLPQHEGRESSLSSLQNQGPHLIMFVGIPAMVSDLR